MNIYILISLYLTFMFFIEYFVKTSRQRKIFLFLLLLPILIISWKRGDFTPDYSNYLNIHSIVGNTSWLNLSQLDLDKGYAIFNKICYTINPNYSFLLFSISFIILSIYYKFFITYSKNLTLSVFLLVSLGSYYTSFNTTRQFLAATICILAFMNYKEHKYKTFFYILLASSIHLSSLVMFIILPLLNVNITKKNNLFLYTTLMFIISLSFFNAPQIIDFISQYIYQRYSSENAFGMSSGAFWGIILRPMMILTYTLFLYKMINFEDRIERMSFLSIVWLLILVAFSLRIEMLQRFTYFVLPYMTILLPNLNNKFIHKSTRYTFNIILLLMCLGYSIIMQRNVAYIFA